MRLKIILRFNVYAYFYLVDRFGRRNGEERAGYQKDEMHDCNTQSVSS